MSIEDIENRHDDMGVNDERHARLLRDVVAVRNFSEHSDDSNVHYAFEIAKWVADHFEYLAHGGSGEINGERLPIAIKALVGYEWAPGGELRVVYPSGSTIDMAAKVEKVSVRHPSRLGHIITSRLSEGATLAEIVAHVERSIKDDSSIIEEHIALSDTVTSESIKIDWHYPNFAAGGLILETDGIHINVLPYGEPDVVSRLLPLVTNYKSDSSELSALVTELAILAAEHCLPRAPQFTTDRKEIEQFGRTVADI